jgi:hypothetical protein
LLRIGQDSAELREGTDPPGKAGVFGGGNSGEVSAVRHEREPVIGYPSLLTRCQRIAIIHRLLRFSQIQERINLR